MFDADGEADEVRGDAGGELLGFVELGVGGGSRMDGQALGIADVGEMLEDAELLDEALPVGRASLDAEDDHAAALTFEVSLVQRELGIIGQAGIADPGDLRVGLEVFGDGEGILAMPLHPQCERFDALEEKPGIIRGNAGAEVAQRHRASPQDECQRSQCGREIVAPAQPVVTVVRLVVKRVFAGGPVEFPAINDDPADARAVTAEPRTMAGGNPAALKTADYIINNLRADKANAVKK